MIWAARYVGLPFVDGGRSINGSDCWGLVRLVLKEQCGIDVPSYGEIAAKELMRVARQMARDSDGDCWRLVHAPDTFDVVLMTAPKVRGRVPAHVGVMVDPARVLHIEEATDSVIVPLTHPAIRNRVLGFRKHTGLVNA